MSCIQGRNEEVKGGTIPRSPKHYGRAESLRVVPNHYWECLMTAWGAEKSQHCHKYFLQYSTFTSERPQIRIWEGQTCFLSGRHLTSLHPCL